MRSTGAELMRLGAPAPARRPGRHGGRAAQQAAAARRALAAGRSVCRAAAGRAGAGGCQGHPARCHAGTVSGASPLLVAGGGCCLTCARRQLDTRPLGTFLMAPAGALQTCLSSVNCTDHDCAPTPQVLHPSNRDPRGCAGRGHGAAAVACAVARCPALCGLAGDGTGSKRARAGGAQGGGGGGGTGRSGQRQQRSGRCGLTLLSAAGRVAVCYRVISAAAEEEGCLACSRAHSGGDLAARPQRAAHLALL